jgi:hypothetical protein
MEDSQELFDGHHVKVYVNENDFVAENSFFPGFFELEPSDNKLEG